jgi:hypothetical protein
MDKIKAYFDHGGSSKIKNLLTVLIAFVILDGILTELLIATGNVREANAFLAPMIGSIGFMVLKVFGALFCALVLWDVYKRHQKLAMKATWVAVIGYGVIVVWNTSLFLIT